MIWPHKQHFISFPASLSAVSVDVWLSHLLEVSIKHLDDGVFPVHVSLVVLRQDLDVLAKAFHLCIYEVQNGGGEHLLKCHMYSKRT